MDDRQGAWPRCADIDPAERGRADRIGIPQRKKTGSPTAAMAHQRRFCRFVGMSVVRRIADENQISSDVADIPIGDIGAWASVSPWPQPRAVKQRVQPAGRFHCGGLQSRLAWSEAPPRRSPELYALSLRRHKL